MDGLGGGGSESMRGKCEEVGGGGRDGLGGGGSEGMRGKCEGVGGGGRDALTSTFLSYERKMCGVK